MSTKTRVEEIILGHDSFRATEILHEEFVIIDRADLPKTTPNESVEAVEVEGVDHSVWPLNNPTADRAYKDALEYLAASEAIKRWTSKQEVLRRREARRRDELASEFTAVNSYNGQLPYTQKLIDRIIELENAA